ncbi:pyridoxamine 5'-phosphate oxidase-domain-containing protein [Delphinella strobiligena]|nr:pyridoxamine 5'-phosphate oxidase-domain-containing protein [Delphinella strobiligena]
MASTSSTQAPKPALWKADFLDHLSKMDSPEFVFSSLHPASGKSPVPYLPRARYCIYRSMWGELPENKHNEAPKNPRVYESELPTFTSDIRMMKIPEVFETGSGHANKSEQMQGSGGGGPVEAVWWIKDTMTQWRIKGEAFVVGEDIGGQSDQSKENSGVRTVKSELGSRMRVVDASKQGEWSWNTELTGHFGNLSPGMRGSFRAPPPGTSKNKPFDDENYKPGMKVEDLHDQYSRKNFRAVVIKPEEVEQLDLSDPEKAFRHKFTYDESSGEWKMEELWP